MDVQIPLLKNLGINFESLAAAADVAQSRLGAFFHDITKLARQDQSALPRHGKRLYEQNFTAGAGPRKPSHHADARRLQPLVRKDLDGTQNCLNIFFAECDFRFKAVIRNALRHLPANGANLTLKLAQTCFSGVTGHQGREPRFGEDQLLAADTVFLQLLGNEMPLGDAELFLKRVAG